MLEFFLALKKGSWVKFIKSFKISKLPKPKKISLSMARIFHFLKAKIQFKVIDNFFE